MVKRVLMVAFHYPPVKGSSGMQRSLRFSTYLRDNGWHPDVLTVRPGAYVKTGDDQLKDIPNDVRITRAFAADAKRHLGLFGVYPSFAAIPDRWASWRIDGVRRGMKLIRETKPDVIWSTFPIATAHHIGMTLAARSGIPWVADCRDSMTEEGYPKDPKVFAAMRELEGNVVRRSDAVVFTAPGALQMYADRYPDVPAERWRLIQNGYDESSFAGLDPVAPPRDAQRPLKLVHAGILYPWERNPLPFFDALAQLKREGAFASRPLHVVLRATGHDERYRDVLRDLDITDIVELAPSVAYRDALQEMMQSDALLIFQADNCNHQIPAKVYEYLRAGRPIFALTDQRGDTAKLLIDNQQTNVCALDDQAAIYKLLPEFLESVATGAAVGASPEVAQRYSRGAQAVELAALLDAVSKKSRLSA